MKRQFWVVRSTAVLSFAALCGYVAAKQPSDTPRSHVSVTPAVTPLEPALVAEVEPSYQVLEPEPGPASYPEDAPLADGVAGEQQATDSEGCPNGMALVEDNYCPTVAHRCVRYLNEKADRCAEFEERSTCFGSTTPMRFCIDRYEFPNRVGAKPVVGMSYQEAEQSCAAEGKRLCKEEEWTLACEGPERTPYPTGYRRDKEQCNYDQTYRIVDENKLKNPATRQAEMDRLDQRRASGEQAECVSAHGVHDMTGNVDEWVVNGAGNRQAAPYKSGLKGGYWGPVRNRCRPMTTDHNEWHTGYQIGFRCCADAPEPEVAPSPAPRQAYSESLMSQAEGAETS